MIGKNDQVTDSDKTERMKIIAEKKKLLEENASKVRAQITTCFEDLTTCIKSREKQLLRQIEAIHNQQLSIIQSNCELICTKPSITVSLDLDQLKNLEEIILKFGKIELPDKESLIVKDADPYRVQEYEEASKDHVSFDKSINIQRNDKNIIIKLSNIHYNKDRLNRSSEDPKILLPSGSINNQIIDNINVDDKNELLSASRLEHESESEVDYNNSSPLCSPLRDSSSPQLPHSTNSLSIDEDTLNSSVCSNQPEIDESNAIISSTTSSPGIKNNLDDENNLNNIKQIQENYNDINSSQIQINHITNDSQLADEHPKQIQQWLQQILTESETEPSIQEIGQLTEITKFNCSKSSLGT